MKTIKVTTSLLALLLLVIFALHSCTEEEISIPAPSTQADFTYSIEMTTDAESGDINYIVSFENKSLQAAGYHWDFGNSNTSDEENPVEVYTQDGVYDVTLVVEPKNELHYNKLEKTERLSLVSTVFEEGFDDPALEEDFPPEGWTLVDKDGDGHNWYWDFFEDEYYILSDSWLSSTGEALEPDNWIITPQIDLSEIDGAALDFEVTPRASGPQYRTENYSVLISVNSTDPDDFETIYTERLLPEMENWVWLLRTLDISDYAGEKIHIAFRHHDSVDLYSIALTNIHVYISE